MRNGTDNGRHLQALGSRISNMSRSDRAAQRPWVAAPLDRHSGPGSAQDHPPVAERDHRQAAESEETIPRGVGDAVRASVLYDLLTPSADKIASDLAEGCAGSVERLLGVLAAMLGRDDDAIRHLRTAIAVNTAIGSRPWVAEAQVELAGLLLGLGEQDEALDLLTDAAATTAALGMVPLRERGAALMA